MTELISVKLGHAIKVGTKSGLFWCLPDYKITLDGVRVTCTEKRTGASTWTTLFNVIEGRDVKNDTVSENAQTKRRTSVK